MITEGYLVRHYQGRRGGRGPAIIDTAQRFEFLSELDDAETRLLRCSLADQWEVQQMIEALGRDE